MGSLTKTVIDAKVLRLDRETLTVAALSVTDSEQGSEESHHSVLHKVLEGIEDEQLGIKYMLT